MTGQTFFARLSLEAIVMKEEIRIIYSDIDGTLLDRNHRMTEKTERAIRSLKEKGIPFVLASSRGEMAILPILRRYHLSCPMVSYGGALILDEDGTVIAEFPMDINEVIRLLSFLERENLPVSYNVYDRYHWYVKDRNDPRIKTEEDIVEVEAEEGTIDDIRKMKSVDKVLLMVETENILTVEQSLRIAFPHLSIMKSSATLIEINQSGISKAVGIRAFSEAKHYRLEESMAFGDNYNDVEMLSLVTYPVLMGNAPEALKQRGYELTEDNNHDGIYFSLLHHGLITQ